MFDLLVDGSQSFFRYGTDVFVETPFPPVITPYRLLWESHKATLDTSTPQSNFQIRFLRLPRLTIVKTFQIYYRK